MICLRAKYHSSSPWKFWWKISFQAVDMDCKKKMRRLTDLAWQDFVHRLRYPFFTNALIIGWLDQSSMMPSKNKSWNCFLSGLCLDSRQTHWSSGQRSATAMVKPFERTLLESGRTSQTKKYNLLKPSNQFFLQSLYLHNMYTKPCLQEKTVFSCIFHRYFAEMTQRETSIPTLCHSGLPNLPSLPSLPDFHAALVMDPPTR